MLADHALWRARAAVCVATFMVPVIMGLPAARAAESPAPGTSGALNLDWHTVDGGGRTFSTGGNWSMGCTIGQHDAGQLSGGPWELAGGFWRGGTTFTTSVAEDPRTTPAPAPGGSLPTTFRYAGAAPNPFNPLTMISFDLPDERPVRLAIYNAAGELVRELLGERLGAGHHRLPWDGTDNGGRTVASGVYYLRLVAGDAHAEQKLVMVK